MSKVTVWSAFAAAAIERGAGKYKAPDWSGDVDVANPDDAWRFFNRIDRADSQRLAGVGYTLPSLSVGDLLTIDGTTYLCRPLGFSEADDVLVRQLKSEPERAWQFAHGFVVE